MNDEIESITPMSDTPHPRILAREAISSYYGVVHTADAVAENGAPLFIAPHLTQAMIDGSGSRDTVGYTRRAVRGHHASLLRKILNFF